MSVFTKRILCWEDTKKICEDEEIEKPDSSMKVKYNVSIYENRQKELFSKRLFFDMDTIDCALLFSKPLVLNLADNYLPGGYVEQGASAQEESLFRRTNYFQTLKKEMYPIQKDEYIYSPNVSIIKRNEDENWTRYDIIQKLDFIACPGIKYPCTTYKNCLEYLNENDVETLKMKIRLIIQCAIEFKHEIIIFGALGCGAWKNPPHHVAKIFKEVLDECDGLGLTYVFAILNTNNKKTIETFREILS